MNTGTFHNLISLWEHCDALCDRINEAREALTDEQWETVCDGPFGEILCAAMDVEAAFEECKEK